MPVDKGREAARNPPPLETVSPPFEVPPRSRSLGERALCFLPQSRQGRWRRSGEAGEGAKHTRRSPALAQDSGGDHRGAERVAARLDAAGIPCRRDDTLITTASGPYVFVPMTFR